MTDGAPRDTLENGSEIRYYDYLDRLKEEVVSRQQVITKGIISLILYHVIRHVGNHQLLTADPSQVYNLNHLDDRF